MVGPPLGGAAIGLFGPVTTVVADAVSYLLSAARASARSAGSEPRPARPDAAAAAGRRPARRLALHPRPPGAAPAVLQHRSLVNGLIMADRAAARRPHARPPRVRAVAVRPRLRRALRRRPARLAAGPPARRPVRAAPGPAHRRDAARAAGRVGLAFIAPGRGRAAAGHRRRARADHLHAASSTRCSPPTGSTRPPTDRVARTLSAWSVSSSASIAALTALWGVLASVTGPRTAIAIAGVLLLATPLLLPRHDRSRRSPSRNWPEPGLTCEIQFDCWVGLWHNRR